MSSRKNNSKSGSGKRGKNGSSSSSASSGTALMVPDDDVVDLTQSPQTPATPHTPATPKISVNAPDPQYIVEKAKSGRAACKVCDLKIGLGDTRIGVLIEGEWGLFTRWQHLHCTVFHKSITSAETQVDGFALMDAKTQKEIEARVEASKNEVDFDTTAIDPDSVVRNEWAEPAPTPADMVVPLMSFQEEGW
jgi:hypothetical protein